MIDRNVYNNQVGTLGKLLVDIHKRHGTSGPADLSVEIKPIPEGGTSVIVERGGRVLEKFKIIYGATIKKLEHIERWQDYRTEIN